MLPRKFLLAAMGCLLLSVTLAVLILAANPKLVNAESFEASETVFDAFGGES